MKKNLTNGLDPVNAKDVEDSFGAALVFRKQLTTYLDKKIETSVVNSASKEHYASPNYALIQADARAYERALREVIGLLN